MPLTKAEVTELKVESATLALLDEWLRQWFDGQAHAVGRNTAVIFPKAHLAYGQGPPTQPLSIAGDATRHGVEIRTVMLPRMEQADHRAGREILARDLVTLNFWVRAAAAGVGNSEALAMETAELLAAICRNPDCRLDLARKGITHLRPVGLPQPVPSVDYVQKLVTVYATVEYAVKYN